MLKQLLLWKARIVGRATDGAPRKDEAGASLVEYALLLALIAVVAIGALTLLGHAVSNTLSNVTNNLQAAGGAGGGGGSPTAPTTITSNPSPIVFNFGTAGTATFSANGSPAPTFSDANNGGSCFTNIGNLTFNAATGTLSYSGSNSGGPTDICITASNASGAIHQEFTITMAP